MEFNIFKYMYLKTNFDLFDVVKMPFQVLRYRKFPAAQTHPKIWFQEMQGEIQINFIAINRR